MDWNYVPKRISILQIGDIHFPSTQAGFPSVDEKEVFQPEPEIFRGNQSSNDLIAKRCVNSLRTSNVDAIAFMGDYTTSGSPDGLQKCLSFLRHKLISPIFREDEYDERVLFVPGNHDVQHLDPNEDDSIFTKFETYENALNLNGFTNSSISNAPKLSIKNANMEAAMFGINTCLGCGELRVLPDNLKADIKMNMDRLVEELAPECSTEDLNLDFLDALRERIDAPIIENHIIHSLSEAIQSLEEEKSARSIVPVVVGHHNLLPQTTPRVATFSELMNSGKLRTFLRSCNLPVVYLHGHIHDDPVEVVFSQNDRGDGVISVSAPMFKDGYNIVEINYDSRGFSLGVRVRKYRMSSDGLFTKHKIDIPFQFGAYKLSNLSELALSVFKHLSTKKAPAYFSEICKKHAAAEQQQIADAVMELEWMGSVEVSNMEENPSHWVLTESK